MEPTPQEIASFTTIDSVADWANLAHRLPDVPQPSSPRGSWLAHVGASPNLPFGILGGIHKGEYEALMESWRIDGGNPSAVQKAMAGVLGTACRIAVGVEKSRAQITEESRQTRDHALALATLQAQAAQTGGGQAASGPHVPPISASGANTVKMATVVDQAHGGETAPMSESDVADAYERYRLKQGDVPSAEEDVTREQLTGLKTLFADGAPPYADFAIFGPFGRRIQKRLKTSGLVIGASGALQMQAILGPPTIDDWKASWIVFRTGSIMLDQITPATCDYYMKHIAEYAARYGPEVWPLVYQSDVRARLEHLARIVRACHAEHKKAISLNAPSEFDPKRPWEQAFRRLVDDVKFWRRELEEPALLIKTSAGRLHDSLSDDAEISRGRQQQQASKKRNLDDNQSDKSRAPWQKEKKRNKREASDRAHKVGASGMFTHNRNDKPLCEDYQGGQCSGKELQCPKDPNKMHQCAKCLLQGHGASSCRGQMAREPSKGKGKSGKSRKPPF